MYSRIAYTVAILAIFVTSATAQTTEDFRGLGFGVGLSLTVDTGDKDRVKSASVVNDIVRVEEDNTVARIMLESHYFFEPDDLMPIFKLPRKQWGHRPFVAAQPGTNEIIEAVGIGWMVGMKRSNDDSGTNSWNIGIGYVVDPNVQNLGDGIKENEPLPEGETQVRFKEKSQGGILNLTSFTW